MERATFTVGVFGLAAKLIEGEVRIKVNVRTDQVRQRKLAKVPEDWPGVIVDMPGGGIELTDFESSASGFLPGLCREVGQETGGCTVLPLQQHFEGPVIAITNRDDIHRPIGDLAYWLPIRLDGDPQPSDEASDHPWLTLKELMSGEQYRPVGGLGLQGRTGRILQAGFAWFELQRSNAMVFSE